MNDAQLPNNDQDRELARQLRRWQEDQPAGEAPASNDPLFETLRAFRAGYQDEKNAGAVSPETSSAMWAAIDAATRPRQHARIHQMRPSYFRYAIAASLLVAIGLSWLLLYQFQKPLLLAEAGTEMVTYSAEDGSQISLRPHSRLYKLSNSDVESAFMLEGEAFFDVVSDPSRTFSVVAGDAMVAVLGTQFLVTGWGEAAEVYLKEGRVQLTHKSAGTELVLNEGDHARFVEDTIVMLGDQQEEEMLDWLSNKLFFEQDAIIDIANELAFHFGIKLNGLDDLALETVTGTLFLDDQQDALESFGITIGGTFVQTSEQTYRFDPN